MIYHLTRGLDRDSIIIVRLIFSLIPPHHTGVTKMPAPQVEEGCAVTFMGGNIVGFVKRVESSTGLAVIIWPDRCGLGEVQNIENLDVVFNRDQILAALQAISPSNQLAARCRSYSLPDGFRDDIQVVEPERQRPYYSPRTQSSRRY